MGRRNQLPGIAARPAFAADAPAGPAPTTAIPLRWIDAHCHVFNAADLPVAEFIEHTRLHSVFALPVYPILQIIAALYKLPVISARSELTQLGGGAAPGAPPALSTLQALYALRGAVPPGGDPAATASLRPLNNGARLLQDTLSDLDATRPADQPLTEEDHVALANKLDSDNQSGGAGAATNEDLLTWVNMLAQPRAHITGQLLSQFPAGANVMITPALVDYNRWLGIDADGDSELSSLNDQVAVMAAVADRCAAQGKVMASFAPFDPWRSIEDPTVLERLQDWLQKGLAVGVKIYPPMGFSAASNGIALAPPPAPQPPNPPDALQDLVRAKYPGMTVGAVLDAEMNKLFELCEALDVPLMAHCACSELANPGNAGLPGPDYWRLALTKWPHLRLNLGHFGGVWQFAATDTDQASLDTTKNAQIWARSIAQLMHDFPNVYADIAYFDLALVDPVQANSPTAQALEFIAGLAQDYPMLVDRLMYGSDWIMVAIVTASSDYVRRVTNAIDTIFGDDLARENLLWRNAAHYLGLRAGDNTRARLTTVLGAQAGLLDAFDPGA